MEAIQSIVLQINFFVVQLYLHYVVLQQFIALANNYWLELLFKNSFLLLMLTVAGKLYFHRCYLFFSPLTVVFVMECGIAVGSRSLHNLTSTISSLRTCQHLAMVSLFSRIYNLAPVVTQNTFLSSNADFPIESHKEDLRVGMENCMV